MQWNNRKQKQFSKSKRQNSIRAKRAERQKSKRSKRAKRAKGQKGQKGQKHKLIFSQSRQSRAKSLSSSDLDPVVRWSNKWSLPSLRWWREEQVEPYLQLSNVVGRHKIHCFDFFLLWDIFQIQLIAKFNLMLLTQVQ